MNQFLFSFFLLQKSLHPEVNKYIDSILATVHTLLNQNFLEKVVLVIKDSVNLCNFVTDVILFSYSNLLKLSKAYISSYNEVFYAVQIVNF